MEKRALFLFGECAEDLFLSRFPVPIAPCEPYTLEGYAMHCNAAGRAFLAPDPTARVSGLLCHAEPSLLWAMDQWKGAPLLQRTPAPAHPEIDIYIENCAAPERAPALPLAVALDHFSCLYQENELGKCDVHLMFPCSFGHFHGEASVADAVTGDLIAQLTKANAEEFSGEYLTLQREALGTFSFELGFSDADQKKHVQTGLIHYAVHTPTQIGTVSVVFPNALVSALQILNVFCSNAILLRTAEGSLPLIDWLEKAHGLTLHGTPRAVLFAHNPLSKEHILNCLAMERHPMAPLIGPTLNSYAADNFAQYDLAEVYASPKCLLEIEKDCCCTLSDRLATESIEIFFVELLSMQTASIHRVCSNVLEYMQDTERLGAEKDYNRLITLSAEMSAAVLFFDYDRFLYPTVSIACKKISQRFGMEEELQKYYQYREILEQMINLAHEQREKIEGDNMNLLLLLLTIVQVLPTLIDTFTMIQSNSFSPSILLSWLYSILACGLLVGLFSWYKRRTIRRINNARKRRT